MNEAHNTDCMDAMAQMKDNEFDWGITDPPYFTGPEKRKYYGNEFSSHGVKRIDYPITETWEIPTQQYYNELCRVTKNQIIWGINYFEFIGIGSGRIIWDKVNQASSFSDCEIAYCSAHDSVRLFRYMWCGMMQGKSIKEGHIMQGDKTKNEKKIHVTQKPIILYKWLFNKYVKEGESIYDSHLGSGSSRISAYEMGIDFYGTEKDETIFNTQEERYKYAIQQQSMFKPNEMY